MPTAKDILDRYGELKNIRGTWEAHWQEIADYGLGRRDFTTNDITPGRKRQGGMIYDNTFMRAGEMLAAGLHSLLSNPATRWFRLRFEDDRLMEIEEAVLWLQLVEHQLYAAFNRSAAGYNAAQHEGYTDIVNFGTGGTYMEESPTGVIFMSAPLSGLYLAENERQRLDTFMWMRRLTARQIVQKYGSVSEKATKAVGAGRGEETYEVLRAVFPREDPVVGSNRPRGMPWASYHIDVGDQKILKEGGYRECPFAIGRWNKEAGETYARGPGMLALPSLRVCQEQKKTLLKAAQKRTDPPLIVPSDNVIQALQVQPGGISVAKSAYMQGGKAPIWPLDSGSDLPIGIEMLQLERTDIRSAFHWELLQLIQHTPGTTPPTATQIAEIASNQQRVISPILGRLQTELLEPEVERVFHVELRAGRLPEVPPVLAGQNIKVDYISPAARAQRQQDAQAIRRMMTAALEYAQADPNVLRPIRADEALRVIADAEGVPPSVLKSRAQVEKELQAERALAAQQAQEEQMAQRIETISKAAPALQTIQGGRAA